MSTSVNVRPSANQISLMEKLGLVPAATSGECSRMIDVKLAEINSVPPTPKQKARLSGLGGRDLPGGNIREVSTAIYLAEAIALLDQAAGEAETTEALRVLESRVRERLMKRTSGSAVKPVEAPAETAPF
jgi:hypothetical protein